MIPLQTVSWLHQQLEHQDLVILELGQNEALKDIKIPHSQIVNLQKDLSDTENPLPNTLPTAQMFQAQARALGINNNSQIAIVDRKGTFSGPRLWWMFKSMGHEKVVVIDGGLPEWVKKGLPTESFDSPALPKAKGDFEARPDTSYWRDMSFVAQNISQPKAMLIDARSAGRFSGSAPEPREGLNSGHIPQSLNLPYTAVLEGGKFKTLTELKTVFKDFNVQDKAIVFSCGSGVTACVLALAAEMAITNEKSVYDGSWTEWAQSGNETVKD